ncbi:hypothetical protein Tco_0355887 [Tanacetum coccineum]
MGKKRKQIARKGLHTAKDEAEKDEASEEDDSSSGTNVPINPVPVAVKSPSIASYKIIKQGKKGVYQIVRENGLDKRFGTEGPTDDYERVFWENLKTMFDAPLSTDLVWSLPERKYPLSANVCQTMLKMKLLDEKMNEDCNKLLKMVEKQAVEERRVWVLANHHTTNGHQFTMSNRHKDWLVQEQTTLGKDFSNPFMADNLPKIVWLSTHHIYVCKELAIPQGHDNNQGEPQEEPIESQPPPNASIPSTSQPTTEPHPDQALLLEVKNLFIQEDHHVAVHE